MKKVLSLILVCTMVLSFAVALNVSAAGEGYTIVAAQVGTKKVGPSTKLNFDASASTYNAYTHYTDATWENSEEATAIALQISTDTAASGGYVAIDYDVNKVIPAAIVYADGSVYGQTYSALTDGGVFGAYDWVQSASKNVTITQDLNATAVANGNLVVTWTGGVSANETLAYVTFFLKSGVTTDNFDKDTFKIATDEAFMNTYKLRNGGASLDYQGTTYKVNENTLAVSITYPNSDKGDEPGPSAWTTTTDATEAGFNTAQDIQFRTETAKDAADAANGASADIKSKVVIFAKNTTGAELAPQTYGIQIGNAFYPGVGTVLADQYWAIILVDTTDSKLTVGTTYDYSAKINGTEIGTGTATVQ